MISSLKSLWARKEKHQGPDLYLVAVVVVFVVVVVGVVVVVVCWFVGCSYCRRPSLE